MFTIADVIRLLTRIFVKQNKRFPKGLEGVDIRLTAKEIHDVGKINNYQGGISEDQLKQFLAWKKQAPIKKEVSKDTLKVPEKKGEVIKVDFDPGGKRTFITEAEKKAELDKVLGPPDEVFGSPMKDWHMEKFKKPGAKDVTPIKQTEKQIKSKIEGQNKATIQKMRLKKLRKDVLNEIENRKKEDHIGDIIDPEDYGFSVSDDTWTDEVEELMQMLIRDDKAYGGIAGMLGEPTYAGGGRVPFIFGGGAIKTALGRLKDLKKMKHGEKMLKKNPDILHLLSTADKQTLQGLETQFSEQLLKMLKKDRELMLHLQSNKAMKDEGLDFLMKKMQEDFAPHIKKYKSIENDYQ